MNRELKQLRKVDPVAFAARVREALEASEGFIGKAAESLGLEWRTLMRWLDDLEKKGHVWAAPHSTPGSLRQQPGRTKRKVDQGVAAADDGTREIRRVIVALLRGHRRARPTEVMLTPLLVAMVCEVCGVAPAAVCEVLQSTEGVRLLGGSYPTMMTTTHTPATLQAYELTPRGEDGAMLLRAILL